MPPRRNRAPASDPTKHLRVRDDIPTIEEHLDLLKRLLDFEEEERREASEELKEVDKTIKKVEDDIAKTEVMEERAAVEADKDRARTAKAGLERFLDTLLRRKGELARKRDGLA